MREMLFAGEEVLLRVRYVSLSRAVSPFLMDTGGLALVWLFVCLVLGRLLFVLLFVLFGWLLLVFGFCCFSYPSGCESFHTEAVKSVTLSLVKEGIRLIRGDYPVSLLDSSYGLPVSQRSAAACELKKKAYKDEVDIRITASQ